MLDNKTDTQEQVTQTLGLPLGKRVYISGPMSGMDKDNEFSFMKWDKMLTDMGYVTVNPHVLNAEIGRHQKYSTYLKRDIKELLSCDAIFMLPGWHRSPGAQFELKQACIQAIPVFFSPEC